MAKKTRTVEYNVCDECETETRYVNKCCLCGKETCSAHSHASPIGSYYFCSSCFFSEFKEEYDSFTKEWEESRAKQDIESNKIINKFEEKMDRLIEMHNE